MKTENKDFILKLVKETIIRKTTDVWFDESKLDDELKQKSGCFVTLHKNKQLRGCIGYILPVEKLYKAIIDNSYNAAFNDYRFIPVSNNEIDELEFEVSVLTTPKKISYKDHNDLINLLTPEVDGVILSYNGKSATFLPQVWEQLPNKVSFLTNLCLKAGLMHDDWKTKPVSIETYKVEIIK